MDSTTSASVLNMETSTPETTTATVELDEVEAVSEDDRTSFIVLRHPQQQQQQQQQRGTRLWEVFGRRLPRSEIVFFCQTFLIYAVVVTSLVNLTLKNGPINLWIALLGSCLGYLLPHPSIDQRRTDNKERQQEQQQQQQQQQQHVLPDFTE